MNQSGARSPMSSIERAMLKRLPVSAGGRPEIIGAPHPPLPARPRGNTDRKRFALSFLLSLLIHALLLNLTFGGKGLGLPGFNFPWNERRIEAPELLLVLIPTLVESQRPLPPAPVRRTVPDGSALESTKQRTEPRKPSASATLAEVIPGTELRPARRAASTPPAKRASSSGERSARPTASAKSARRDVVRAPPVTPVSPAPSAAPPRPSATAAASDRIVKLPELERPKPTEQPNAEVLETAREEAANLAAKQAESARRDAERQEAKQREIAQQREALEARARAEVARLEAERREAERDAEARKDAARRAAARLEAERQEAARQALAKEDLARLEAVRREQARLEAARQEAERLDVARQSEAREEAIRREMARAAEAARVEADRQEAAQEALMRQELARQEAARLEADRVNAERQAEARIEAAQQEAARQEAERQEAERREVARREAARQEAAQQEEARQEAARQEVARQEAARQEAARQEEARQEASRQEAARQEAPRQEATRKEAARLDAARQEAAQAEEQREERLRAIGRQLDEEAVQRDKASAAVRPSPQLPLSISSPRRGRLFGRTDPNAELVRYAEALARKIELNMTFDMVRDAAKLPHRNPMVTLAIRSDGSVESVTFVVSSGATELDEAIRRIVQSQAPYPAFPPALAREFDVIEIRRTWHFDVAIRLY